MWMLVTSIMVLFQNFWSNAKHAEMLSVSHGSPSSSAGIVQPAALLTDVLEPLPS